MNTALQTLQQDIGHTFKSTELLKLAVTHPSLTNEDESVTESNQRLEFLGDAVLQLVLTSELYQLYSAEREGVLSQRRAALTKGSFLSDLAREIHLDACLFLGKSEEESGGRTRDSALEDAFEALIAAVYLDAGIDTATRIIRKIYGPLADRLASRDQIENPKGHLQEKVQPIHGNNALSYDITSTSGQDHAKVYTVTLYFGQEALATGQGSSKKAAEESAARAALATWEVPPEA